MNEHPLIELNRAELVKIKGQISVAKKELEDIKQGKTDALIALTAELKNKIDSTESLKKEAGELHSKNTVESNKNKDMKAELEAKNDILRDDAIKIAKDKADGISKLLKFESELKDKEVSLNQLSKSLNEKASHLAEEADKVSEDIKAGIKAKKATDKAIDELNECIKKNLKSIEDLKDIKKEVEDKQDKLNKGLIDLNHRELAFMNEVDEFEVNKAKLDAKEKDLSERLMNIKMLEAELKERSEAVKSREVKASMELDRVNKIKETLMKENVK